MVENAVPFEVVSLMMLYCIGDSVCWLLYLLQCILPFSPTSSSVSVALASRLLYTTINKLYSLNIN